MTRRPKPWRKRRPTRRRAGEPPLPAPLRVVGGTDAGDRPAPVPWRDPTGARRVLRDAMSTHPERVVVVTLCDGEVDVYSNCPDAETIVGLLHRGASYTDRAACDVGAEDEDDGA